MSRQRLVVVVVLLVAVAGIGLLRRLSRGDPEQLGDADLFAGGGTLSLGGITSGEVGDASLDDVPIVSSKWLAADGQGGFFMEAGGILLHADVDGDIVGAYTTSPRAADAAVSPDGEVAVPTIPGRGDFAGRLVVDLPLSDEHYGFDEGIEVVALAYLSDGTLLFSSSFEEARIEAMTPEGDLTRLLGPPGDEGAEVRLDEPLGPIMSIVALPDDRVVFATEDNKIHVLDDGQVSSLETDPPDLLRGADHDLIDTYNRQPNMTALAPAPDGRVITTGLGSGDVPTISLLDVDTGEAEVLAELEGVQPSSEEPVSAAAVGDDLIFLANDRLWKQEDVFG